MQQDDPDSRSGTMVQEITTLSHHLQSQAKQSIKEADVRCTGNEERCVNHHTAPWNLEGFIPMMNTAGNLQVLSRTLLTGMFVSV